MWELVFRSERSLPIPSPFPNPSIPNAFPFKAFFDTYEYFTFPITRGHFSFFLSGYFQEKLSTSCDYSQNRKYPSFLKTFTLICSWMRCCFFFSCSKFYMRIFLNLMSKNKSQEKNKPFHLLSLIPLSWNYLSSWNFKILFSCIFITSIL